MTDYDAQTAASDAHESENAPAGRRSWKTRLRGGLIALAGIAIIATAVLMTPAKKGHGTHRQIGLKSCSYLSETGYPCPGCGVTTSFTASVHGKFLTALDSQIFGVVLHLMVLAAVGLGVAELVTGRSFFGRLRPNWWWVFTILAFWLGGWALKLALGVSAGKYPIF